MAHFAELDSDNVVQQVIVVSDKNTSDSDGNESEAVGVAYCKSLYGSDTIWKQCSYTMKSRGIYPSAGSLYNSEMDVFHMPSPYPSWVLQSDARWQAPIAVPSDLTHEQTMLGYSYTWNEKTYQADNTKGWTLEVPSILSIDTQPSTDISVAVGSKVTVSADVTANKGEFGISVDYLGDDEEWYPSMWSFETHDAQDDSLSVSATITSGIITATSCAGKYRVVADPIGIAGVGTYSDTITLTVTE